MYWRSVGWYVVWVVVLFGPFGWCGWLISFILLVGYVSVVGYNFLLWDFLPYELLLWYVHC
jgi:hypothetical protein